MKKLKKKFGSFTEEEVKEFYSYLHQLSGVQERIASALSNNQEIAVQMASVMPSSGNLYLIPHCEVVRLLSEMMGTWEAALETLETEDPVRSILDLSSSIHEGIEDPDAVVNLDHPIFSGIDFDMEELACFYAVWNVVVKSIEAVQVFFETMNDLVQKGIEGDDEFLFKAIYIDPSITALPPISQRVKQAKFVNDKDFLKKYSRALQKTYPKRPDPSKDHLRYMTALVSEVNSVNKLTQAQFYELLITRLELDDSDEDTFYRLFQRLKKQKKVKDMKV